MTIRRAHEGDLAAVARFGLALGRLHVGLDARRFVTPPEGERAFAEFFKNELGNEDAVLLVAEADGEPVGYVFVRIEPESIEDLRGRGGWLHDIYIVPDFRGCGVGRRLVEAAIEAARELGSDSLMLGVSPHNVEARGLFESVGLRATMIEMRLELERDIS